MFPTFVEMKRVERELAWVTEQPRNPGVDTDDVSHVSRHVWDRFREPAGDIISLR